MNTLDKLEAIEAIKSVKAKYFRFVDLKRWDDLKGIFTKDAQLTYPEAREEPFHIDEAIVMIIEALKNCVSVHHGHMPEIEITSPTTATAVFAMEDQLYATAAGTAPHGGQRIHGMGHYQETYERQGDRWLIKTLRLTRLRLTVEMPPASVPF